MGLSAEEKKLLEELTAKAKEPDAEDFEIEIWDGGKGARVPFSQGSKWLFENLGIGEQPAPPPGDGGAGDGGQGEGGQGGEGAGRTYFKRQPGAR